MVNAGFQMQAQSLPSTNAMLVHAISPCSSMLSSISQCNQCYARVTHQPEVAASLPSITYLNLLSRHKDETGPNRKRLSPSAENIKHLFKGRHINTRVTTDIIDLIHSMKLEGERTDTLLPQEPHPEITRIGTANPAWLQKVRPCIPYWPQPVLKLMAPTLIG